jgi:hypothetical protein
MSALLRRVRLWFWLGACAVLVLRVAPAAAQDDFGGGDEESSSDGSETASDESGGDGGDEASAEELPEGEQGAFPDEVRFQAFAGAGIGTRSFRRPVRGMGVQRFDETRFPALDIGLRVTAWPTASFSLEFLLRYQTSIGMHIEQQPSFAFENDIAARSSRTELSVAPEFRLGDTPSSVALLFPIGFAMRTLWPEVHTLPIPGYTLAGPQARAELAIPFLDIVTLRFGPEVQWIVMIDKSLQDDRVGYQGVALGGEALLQVQITTLLGVELVYRESHALVPTTVGGETFYDVERFFTARVSGTW